MRVVYGIDIKTYDDKFIRAAEEASETVASTTIPGKFLVDVIPARKYIILPSTLESPFSQINLVRFLPEWFPGMEFQRLGRKWKPIVDGFRNAPFDFAKNAMVDLEKGLYFY